jgi:hypothetical protein
MKSQLIAMFIKLVTSLGTSLMFANHSITSSPHASHLAISSLNPTSDMNIKSALSKLHFFLAENKENKNNVGQTEFCLPFPKFQKCHDP